jgi:hypothetical protein
MENKRLFAGILVRGEVVKIDQLVEACTGKARNPASLHDVALGKEEQVL